MPVAPAPEFGLGVAVRTKKLQIFEPIVEPVAVAMMNLEAERFPLPLVDSALLASVGLVAGLDELLLEARTVRLGAPDHQQVSQRELAWPRNQCASVNRGRPAGEAEPESLCTLSNR